MALKNFQLSLMALAGNGIVITVLTVLTAKKFSLTVKKSVTAQTLIFKNFAQL